MNASTLENSHQNKIKTWIEEELDNETIILKLRSEGLEESQINELQILIKKIRNKNRTRTGSILVLIGVIVLGLGFISCIILHYMGQDINFSLYGLTGIGAIVLIVGLVLIFN
jgi:hypothetical protein